MKYKSIDHIQALNQLGGSEKLYKTIVTGFYDRYRRVDEVINDSLELGDKEEARRMTHSIKGLCGNLGAGELGKKARMLENAIVEDEQDVYQYLHAFSEELFLVVEDIRRILVERYEVNERSARPKDPVYDRFMNDCNDLSSALASYRYSDINAALDHLMTKGVPEAHTVRLDQVARFIDVFEYDMAKGLLREVHE